MKLQNVPYIIEYKIKIFVEVKVGTNITLDVNSYQIIS